MQRTGRHKVRKTRNSTKRTRSTSSTSSIHSFAHIATQTTPRSIKSNEKRYERSRSLASYTSTTTTTLSRNNTSYRFLSTQPLDNIIDESSTVKAPQQIYQSSLPPLKATVAPNNLPYNVDPAVPRVSGLPPLKTMYNLMGWVVRHGGKVHPAVFYGSLSTLRHKDETDNGNWKGLALNDIPAGTTLAEVPLPLCLFPLERPMSQTDAKIHTQSDLFYNSVSGVINVVSPSFWELRLGVRLLAERAADDSFYKPYIDALPSQFPTFPLFFSQKAGQSLQYRPMQVELLHRTKAIMNIATKMTMPTTDFDPNKITPLARFGLGAFNGAEVHVGDLAWATAAVSSRAFDCPLPSSKQGLGPDASTKTPSSMEALKSYKKCLVPLVDMLNHSFTPNCEVVFKYTGTSPYDPDDVNCRKDVKCLLKTKTDIRKGEELTITYFKTSPETAPVVEKVTPENEKRLAEEIENCFNMKKLFDLSLKRIPSITQDGLLSTVNNNNLLRSFGFMPSFNVSDDLTLSPDPTFFDTALEMAHDITVSHSYMAGKLSTSAGMSVSHTKPAVGDHDKNQPGDGKSDNKGHPDTTDTDKATKGDGSPQQQSPTALFGEENTYDSAFLKLVLPTPKQRTEDQALLLHYIFSQQKRHQEESSHSLRSTIQNPLSVTWRGPSDILLAICRIIAAGSHFADQRISEQAKLQSQSSGDTSSPSSSNSEDSVNIEREIIRKQDSETRVHAQVESTIDQVFEIADQRARAILATEGHVVPDDEDLNGAQLLRGFTSAPISKENELGAMAVLYHALVVASGSFTTPVTKDVEGYYQSLLARNPGEATAFLFARGKKSLITHLMKVLATQIGLDSEQNVTHKWHARLDK